ncbi:uncharacterized protein LOC110721770 [Chenopodium quinoa]|uniref:uncharacterized protein LOC110721770 n=1 Tax=Chenopodium quinoa TaxID=63459 RepID=UPI000B77077C|nr:uncharacterized protein LOC110721770 [Chenopodium quinoa]
MEGIHHNRVVIGVHRKVVQLEYTEQMVEGKLVPTVEKNPFTLALGIPYHLGRVVGSGGTLLGWEKVMGPEYTKSGRSRASVNSPLDLDAKVASIKEQVGTPTHVDSRELDNPTPHEFPDLQEETRCALLHPGLSNSGELHLVAYASAQPTYDTVHLRSLRPQHYSVGINSGIVGFYDIRLMVPIEEDGITTLWEAKGSFVQWPRA